jgi:hypothetical protein
MDKKSNSKEFLVKSVFFIITLCLSTYLVLWIEKLKPSDLGTYKNMFIKEVVIKKRSTYNVRRPVGALSNTELRYAATAWKYFANNCNPSTGMVSKTDHGNFFTLSDLGDYLMALTSAYEMNVVDSNEFNNRMTKALLTLKKLPLFENKLPNKRYSTDALQMLDEQNKVSKTGIGWSSLDVGRFFGVVQKLLVDYPQYVPLLKASIDHWNLKDMILGGSMYGITRNDEGAFIKEMEGKLGMEEYCAKGLLLSGFDVTESMSYTDFLKFVEIYDVDIAIDTRILKEKANDNYILSDPYILDGLEFGWDVNSRELARRIFDVQKKRYEKEKIVTAVSEDFILSAPYYVINAIYMDGKKWNCEDKMGNDASQKKTISTKAAFGWYALFADAYSDVLLNAVKDLYDPAKGWYSGKFEISGKPNTTITSKTNAMVLEALDFKANGKLIRL